MRSIRLYNRGLTAEEIAVNAAVDKIRFEGADLSILPAGWHYNETLARVVPDGTEAFNVAGELLTVNEETFARLDRLEGFPNLYGRERITVLLEDGSRAEAWVYVMRRLPLRSVVIEGGDWRPYRREAEMPLAAHRSFGDR